MLRSPPRCCSKPWLIALLNRLGITLPRTIGFLNCPDTSGEDFDFAQVLAAPGGRAGEGGGLVMDSCSHLPGASPTGNAMP
jgi:hypothetical protein